MIAQKDSITRFRIRVCSGFSGGGSRLRGAALVAPTGASRSIATASSLTSALGAGSAGMSV